MVNGHGATLEDWTFFSETLELRADLLPVVSNPEAVISLKSKMKGVGKTPSVYNRDRNAVGMRDWTEHQASADDIEKWSHEPDYGICVQTRTVRALDVDVPDVGVADRIRDIIYQYIHGVTGSILPFRFRDNSAKFLLAFQLIGDIPKRVIKVRKKVVDADGKTLEPAWVIEFLATGQQFVACGTHASGARIQWQWNGHDNFPLLTLEQFDELWRLLEIEFACEPSSTGSGARKRGDDLAIHDDIADRLFELGLVHEYGSDGQAFIDCPWKDGHSMDSGITETAYFPAGTGGYERGHFKCLHAGCVAKRNDEFEDALGLRSMDFEEIPEPAELPRQAPAAPVKKAPAVYRDKPRYVGRNEKSGKVPASLHNVVLAVERADVCGASIRYDEFRDEIMYAPADRPEAWRPFNDADYVELRLFLERGDFDPINAQMIKDVILRVSSKARFDSAGEWLRGLKWDGVSRVSGFLHNYLGVEDSEYATAVSDYLWSALAGRIAAPGCQVDMVPVLVGPQGARKSTAIKAMCPGPDFFVEVSLAERDDDLSRRMRGKLIAEIPELRGLAGKDNESIKAFLTRTHEDWIPKYKEFATNFPRRLVFIGSTNEKQFLSDVTGNRRWLPVEVGDIDTAGIKRDCVQLWAEAFIMFQAFGVSYREAEELGRQVHGRHTVTDPWEDDVDDYLDQIDDTDESSPRTRNFVRVQDIAMDCLGLGSRSQERKVRDRIRAILFKFGWVEGDKYINGKRRDGFKPQMDSNGL